LTTTELVEPSERVGVDHAPSRVRQGVDADVIGPVEQLVEIRFLDTVLRHLVGLDERVVGDEISVESGDLLGRAPGDRAERDESDRRRAHAADRSSDLPAPAVVDDVIVVRLQRPQAGQKQRNGVNRHLVGAVVRGASDGDAALGGGAHVDVIHPNCGPDDGPQVEPAERAPRR